MKTKNLWESLWKWIFFLSAAFSIFALVIIIYFIFVNGAPFMFEYGIGDFLFGTSWTPSNRPASFGILPMIIGSIYITIGAILFGVPTGIFTAVFMSYYAPKKLIKVLRPAVNLMAAIPSIVYGYFGLQVIVPIVKSIFGGTGLNILTASIVLGVMILPTIIAMSESTLNTVSKDYYTGSLALGADHDRTVYRVILPAAKSGVISSIILGIGRAVGETMAVVLIAGNQPRIPVSILKGTRTMTTNIVLEMAYATGDHRSALIATAVVLFIFILIINGIFAVVKRRA